MRPWECSQTDRPTDRLTDANRFYSLSHAICYSYGTDNYAVSTNMQPAFLSVRGSCRTVPYGTINSSRILRRLIALGTTRTRQQGGGILHQGLGGLHGCGCQWWSLRASAVTLSISKSASSSHHQLTGSFQRYQQTIGEDKALIADGQGNKWHRNIAENFNRMSRVHERYRRQTTDRRQTDRRRHIANMNMSSRSLIKFNYFRLQYFTSIT